MNKEMLDQMQNKAGFIAALDQSGGSTPKALTNYGVNPNAYSNEDEMFDLIHQERSRIIKSPAFNDRIIGAIIFERTMESKIDGQYSAEYLWSKKHIVPFLKIDDGLADRANGVQLMKDIPELEARLLAAKSHHIFGTKMRSVIFEANEQGISDIVNQQFKLAEQVCSFDLVPIIEPEVNIMAANKEACEEILLAKINNRLESWPHDKKIMFKFTIPSKANLYSQLYQYPSVVRIVALSGGYDLEEACDLLAKNHNMPASFSRALLKNLNIHQSDSEFNDTLNQAVEQIYRASID